MKDRVKLNFNTNNLKEVSQLEYQVKEFPIGNRIEIKIDNKERQKFFIQMFGLPEDSILILLEGGKTRCSIILKELLDVGMKGKLSLIHTRILAGLLLDLYHIPYYEMNIRLLGKKRLDFLQGLFEKYKVKSLEGEENE